ncbi:gliding motility protein GldM [uncultured Polaribacter sp.]|uniref:type IX secretion system motor protein PorM/GldM n=1 Tax=uncultured Polaribacter sp. TaxID=174711 RepID=UPI00262F4938|nr:gliding motility protein GldM [uncultured Polaribacter sp.]
MAGGKMSARQKMINLMYLVFIAMLAMNMSKEVLSSFGFMNEKLTENNISTTAKNNEAYANLATKASEQAAKFGPLKLKADKIKQYSADFYQYLEELKSKMTADIVDKKDYESMDKTAFLDEYFFKGDKFTKEGNEFLAKINGYRTDVNAVLGNGNKFSSVLDKRFSTKAQTNRDDKKIPWLEYRYKGFPLVASLANITQMQADIKNTESDIISNLLGGKLEEALSLNNYKGIVSLDKSAYFAGEKVKGQVVLGRYDATLVPNKVILNGRDATSLVKDGQVVLNMPAGNVGEKTIKGTIFFKENGEDVPVEFNSKYSVIAEPSAAVVSADKMNVVYRGLSNPISVSLPGVSDNNIRVSATGGSLSGSGGKYTIRPSSGNTVNINVSATLSSGNTVNSSSTFRIKDIPAAMGSVRGKYGTVRMPRSGLLNSPISAGLPDFEFDLQINVQSFKIKVPGQLTIIVNGTRLSDAAKRVLGKARRGDQINIYDIKASANGFNLKKVLPVNIELTN